MLLALILLVVLTVYAVFFRGGGGKPTAGADFTPTGQLSPSTTVTPPSPTASSGSPTRARSTAAAVPQPCTAPQLSIAASTSAPSYPAQAKPVVAIVVTNTGPAPCVQDLADSQIELRVYNGSARVWGSHDCAIAPGVSKATLPVGQPIRREMEWTGLSSQPGCAGTRTRVGAGTYTLHALLAGHEGKTTTFTLAG
ncbi:MAG TPA: hypothetical protein VHO01_16705 [Jatrophihabitans sp.]|nr:hypothetical protein [Jatrophihabitans sp.]